MPLISPWHCWAGVSPAWAVGQPHGCALCVRSVVMVTWGWHREEGPLLRTIRMALAIESFVAKEVSMGRVNTERAQSFCPSPGDKWLQVLPQPWGDPGFGVMCGSLGCYLDCRAPYQEPRFYGRRAPKDRQTGLENRCLVLLALGSSGRHMLHIFTHGCRDHFSPRSLGT